VLEEWKKNLSAHYSNTPSRHAFVPPRHHNIIDGI